MPLQSIKYGFACCLFLTVINSFSSEQKNQNCQHGFQMAILLDLDGDQQSLGQAAMNGFLLALSQSKVNESAKLFFSINNTRSNIKTARTIARRIAPDVSLVTGFTDNNSVIATARYFAKNRVPFLSIGATSPELSEAFNNGVFLIPFGDNAQAAAAARFSSKNFGKTAAIFWDNTSEYTSTLPEYFKKAFTSQGGKIVLDRSFGKTCDIGYLAKEIQALPVKPSFVYFAGLPRCIGAQIQSLRVNGVSLPVIGGDGLDTPNLTRQFSVNNVWFTTHAFLSTDNPDPKTRRFLTLYKNAYGILPQDAFAALGFDAANIIIEVVNRKCAHSSQSLTEALQSIRNYHGVSGEYQYSEKTHVPRKTVWLIKIHNGRRLLADKFIPQKVPDPIRPLQ